MEDALSLNGINGTNGDYLIPKATEEQIARIALGAGIKNQFYDDLKARHDSHAQNYGLVFGVDPEDLSQAGWGVVFARDASDELREALAPLLELRMAEAGERYREYRGRDGYWQDDTASAWLARQPRRKAPGPADPKRVPYYLLIVGDPQEIPFRFQYELDVNYAVGRLAFATLDEYCRYARAVVNVESIAHSRHKRAVFFGVRNRGDRATQMSADQLVLPLANLLRDDRAANWSVEQIVEDDATKSTLRDLLTNKDGPSLLLTASHGMGFPGGHPRQLAHQGALLCQDWPGPLLHRGEIPPDFYLSADDLPDDADAHALIAFHFACYGAGTPRLDDYAHATGDRQPIAPHDFIAALPQRLLSLPGGPALGVVGHVERAWSYSFNWPQAGADLTVFESMMSSVMRGCRLASAMDSFGQKHADLAVALNGELEQIKYGRRLDEGKVARLWTAQNDARSFVVLGDPAVRFQPDSK